MITRYCECVSSTATEVTEDEFVGLFGDAPIAITRYLICDKCDGPVVELPASLITDLPHDDDGPYPIPSSPGEDTPDSDHDYSDVTS